MFSFDLLDLKYFFANNQTENKSLVPVVLKKNNKKNEGATLNNRELNF